MPIVPSSTVISWNLLSFPKPWFVLVEKVAVLNLFHYAGDARDHFEMCLSQNHSLKTLAGMHTCSFPPGNDCATSPWSIPITSWVK